MSEVDMGAKEIDRLRFAAFASNSPVDRQAYFDAASKWFQDRHVRAMRREEALSQQLSQARDEALGWLKLIRDQDQGCGGTLSHERVSSSMRVIAQEAIDALKSHTPTEEE